MANPSRNAARIFGGPENYVKWVEGEGANVEIIAVAGSRDSAIVVTYKVPGTPAEPRVSSL